MSTLSVSIVQLPPMRVISAYGYGPQPEDLAHAQMRAFMQAQGLLPEYGTKYRHFGFNNPSPAPGSPNYGYEIWVEAPAEIEPTAGLRVHAFSGGLYAVTRFTGLEKITDVWGALVRWREASPYLPGNHQWLENLHNPLEEDAARLVFDLYLPVLPQS
jgi:DNA gyrase inhibitor GyrI